MSRVPMLLTALALTPLVAPAQTSPTGSFARVAFFVGKWQGTTDGQPGKG
jgi:hypothetical protein